MLKSRICSTLRRQNSNWNLLTSCNIKITIVEMVRMKMMIKTSMMMMTVYYQCNQQYVNNNNVNEPSKINPTHFLKVEINESLIHFLLSIQILCKYTMALRFNWNDFGWWRYQLKNPIGWIMSRIVTCISSSFHVVFVIVISRMNYVIERGYVYGKGVLWSNLHGVTASKQSRWCRGTK